MSNIVISVENLSKRYLIGELERYYTIRDSLTHLLNYPLRLLNKKEIKEKEKEFIWALKDISFEVQHGDIVGIIGRNGAGKSTLLKILSRITPPTEGVVKLNGRVGSLLEVGTGFHPELTGRENIFLNGSILGMSKKEIERKFDEIVDFAEIEKFLDTPVKRYSSGMYVRLAFAVAAHMEPEILVVDEVLAVGDIQFQTKCLGKMDDVSKEGRTILFVSHNIASIQRLCSSCIYLQSGKLILNEKTDEVVDSYLRETIKSVESGLLSERNDRMGNGMIRFTSVKLLNGNGSEIITPQTGSSLTIKLEYIKNNLIKGNYIFQLSFLNQYGQRLFICLSRSTMNSLSKIPEGNAVHCHITKLPLVPGTYTVDIWCKVDEVIADYIHNAFNIEVVPGDFFGTGKLNPKEGGDILVDHYWEIN